MTHNIPDGMVAAGSPAKIICTTQEYLEKNKEYMKTAPMYDEDYTLRGNLTEEKKEQMVTDLESGIGYVD